MVLSDGFFVLPIESLYAWLMSVSDVYSRNLAQWKVELDSNVQQPWRGRTTLIFALLAVSLGLGNVLRLPFVIGEQGGGAFLLVYLAVLAVVVCPVLVVELSIGSMGRSSPMGSVQWVASLAGRDTRWRWIGALQALLAFLVATLLLVPMVLGAEATLAVYENQWNSASATDIVASLSNIQTADHLKILGVLIFVVTLAALPGPQVVLLLAGWLLMPMILLMIYASLGFAFEVGDLSAANEWIFKFRPEQLTQQGVVTAALTALSSLGAGVGVGLVFGSRSPQGLPLIRSVIAVGILDTAAMLLLAIVIVAITAAVDVEMTQGLALFVVAIPYAFVNLPTGELYGVLVMGSILLSSLAALIALVEPMVSILRRELYVPRPIAMGLVALGLWLSASLAITHQATRLTMDSWLVPVLVPAVLGVTALFAGWRVPRPILRTETFQEPFYVFYLWFFILRWLTPALCFTLSVLAFMRVAG
jgi:NSS family neurotransmitter:Na+ symporter